jgi:ArsR family transcriptional regulator, zinc-responsive transcriptional repressor
MDVTEHKRLAAAGELLRALAAPMRIAIVTELARGGVRCVHQLVDALDAPQPLVSQHLRVLRMAGVVHGSRRGRETEYSLTDDHIAHIVADAVTHANEPGLPSSAREPSAGATGTPR